MRFFSNKFLISFLILTVLIYGFSAKQAEAKGVANFFGNVFAVVINLILGSLETVWGNLLGIKWLSADGNCRLGNLSGTVIKDYSKECGDDSSGGGGTAGSPTLQNQTATPIMSADGTCTTGFTLNYSVTDAYKYAIYRDKQQIYQSGFLGDTRKKKCFTDEYGNPEGDCPVVEEEPIGYNDDGTPYYEIVYDSDGNYIGKRGRKVYYRNEYYTWPSPYNYSFSYTDTNNIAPNKDYEYEVILLDKNGTQYRYPQLNAYSECIKLDLKINGSDGPTTANVARNYAVLDWITEGALSCSASGDWSGSKGPATGREDFGKLPRGTSNPGKGKTYNYSMSCQYPKDKTLSDSVSITVFKYPDCDFSADPAVIEVLPAT